MRTWLTALHLAAVAALAAAPAAAQGRQETLLVVVESGPNSAMPTRCLKRGLRLSVGSWKTIWQYVIRQS